MPEQDISVLKGQQDATVYSLAQYVKDNATVTKTELYHPTRTEYKHSIAFFRNIITVHGRSDSWMDSITKEVII